MTFSIAKLFEYFGLTGALSAVVWLASGFILVSAVSRGRKTRRYWTALGVAVAGLLLARLNSYHVNQIRYDQTEEIRAGRELGQSLAAQASGTNVTSDLADPGLVLTHANAGAEKHSYRDGGKVEREGGKQLGEEVAGVETKPEQEPSYRTMKAEDVHRANHYDKVNLLCARFMLWLALLLVVLDYLCRLNSTFDAYFPLPLASPWLDAAIPKTFSVRLDAGERERVKGGLEQAVRKGETFVYFGKADPWRRDTLPRVALLGRELWPLGKLRCSVDGEPFVGAYVFESAWFGRYCFIVEGADLSLQWLAGLERFLIRRQAVRAMARRTVNVVWDLDERIPEERLEELVFLCRETNHRLIVLSP